MKNEVARREIEFLDYYLQNHSDDYSEESHTAMMMARDALKQEPIFDKIRAEIEMYELDCRLQEDTHECEKCNDNVFGSIYRIIDKYKAESEDEE